MFSVILATYGLKLGDNNPERTIKCHVCDQQFAFDTASMTWENDDVFEFCDVASEKCGHFFQICAVSDGHEYEFFTTSL